MGDRRSVDDVQPFAELFRSGTTVVYKAYQPSLERVVLLKRLLPEASLDARVVERFSDEARLVARIQHPNVVKILSFGYDDESPYLVAEFVDGLDLAELVSRGPVPVSLALFILREAVRGIGAAHDSGILHRDVKPSNILLSFEGEVKVVDFGFASIEDEVEDLQEIRGTLPYLAPEQVKGEPPSRSTDLFALGATFFEMLTGRRAFLGNDSSTILESVLHYDPVPQLAAKVEVPAEVIAICGRLMSRFVEERYEFWHELEAECTAILECLPDEVGARELAGFIEDPDTFIDPLSERADVREESPEETVAEGSSLRAREWRLAVPAAFMIFTILFVMAALGGYFGRQDAGDDVANRIIEDVRYPLWLYPLGPDGREAAETVEDELEELEPLPARVDRRGAVRLNVEPWAVVIAGRDTLGRAPFADRIYLAEGRHRLTFLHPEFPAYQRTIVVEPNRDQTVNVSLWESVGRLRIEVSPWAAVSIDGVARDTIPPQPNPYVLAPGSYRLALDHPVLGRYETDVLLGAGEQRTLRFNLYELLQ
jgi:eukaryotic-like serine/threonine-protein kinase